MAQIKFVSVDKLLYFKQKITGLLDKKVDKVFGKQLSTNDYTTAEKNKLAGLSNYSLPTASSTTKGGIKVGAGLAITEDGILSATGGGTADAVEWENVIGKPTKLSQFTNDSGFQNALQVNAIVDGKGFLKAVPAEYVTETELTEKGYQTANQVTTAITSKGYQTSAQVQSAINSALSGITGIDFQVVSELPVSGKKGVIYLIKHSHGAQDIYDEYIWVTDKFEKIGNTDIDLSGYWKKTDLTECTNGDIDAIFA